MRTVADAGKVTAFMRAFGREARGPGRVYLTGGATAVLEGWRQTTVDIDLKLDPEPAGAFEAILRIKNELDINVELAAPDDFIPALPGWRDRSRFIAREGQVDFFHYDVYSQVLAKIERGHARDLQDAEQMANRGLIERQRVGELFEAIRRDLIRYPAIEETAFVQKVRAFVEGGS